MPVQARNGVQSILKRTSGQARFNFPVSLKVIAIGDGDAKAHHANHHYCLMYRQVPSAREKVVNEQGRRNRQ